MRSRPCCTRCLWASTRSRRAEALSGSYAPATRSAGVGPLLPASSGVYAVYDATGALQYVGMSRKARGACAERTSPAARFLADASPGEQMNASIMIHMQDMPAEKCASVKLHVVEVRSCERRLRGACMLTLCVLTPSAMVSCASQAQTRDALQGAWKQWVEEHGACSALLGCAV